MSLEAHFEREFGRAPAATAAAPGRVNLIGEHTDYTGGWVLPAALSLELRVALRFRDDAHVRGVSRELGTAEAELEAPPSGDWLDYPRGVARTLGEERRLPHPGPPGKGRGGPSGKGGGFELWIESELPEGAGLSSSAALSVATALALAAAAGARFRTDERVELAQVCQRAESRFVGVPCGIMDPYAIACASTGCATLLRCDDLEARSVALPFEIAVFDTGARRALRDGSYTARTQECAAGLEAARRILDRALPRLASLTTADLPALEGRLEPVLWKRVRHVVGENERVHAFAQALPRHDRAALAALLYASHASLRDDFEASWPEADFLVERAQSAEGVIGARMTGAGWGGCTVQLLDEGADLGAIQGAFRAEFGRELGVWRAPPAAGARLLSPV